VAARSASDERRGKAVPQKAPRRRAGNTVRRAILSPVLLAAALVLQLTVVNRLPLPGTGPDLVLLTVVALSLCGGPAAGAVTGFGAGLALDIAPPGSYLLGEYALVFCVVG
jgi:rod shape-determining protein MreD